jgi:DNA primase small subunit
VLGLCISRDHAIRDQFAFRHLLWVYSGRGINLWVSDPDAMDLTDEQSPRRRSIVQGGKDMHKNVNVRVGSRPLPPSLA